MCVLIGCGGYVLDVVCGGLYWYLFYCFVGYVFVVVCYYGVLYW